MNAQPHTHDVRVRRPQYPDRPGTAFTVAYGDTRVYVCRGPFVERRVQRAVKRAIRKHDKGSIRAGIAAQREVERMERIQQKVRAVTSEWAQDAPNADEEARMAQMEALRERSMMRRGDYTAQRRRYGLAETIDRVTEP